MKNLLLVLAALALISGCTKKSDSGGGAAAAATDNNPQLSSVAELMAYDKVELNVKAGEKVTLTFKNSSQTLKHNWVLTKPGKDNDVGLAGMKVGEAKGFIPESPDVLAHTNLVNPGATDTVTFTAPAKGNYPYICTNAGHHIAMKGVLHSL